MSDPVTATPVVVGCGPEHAHASFTVPPALLAAADARGIDRGKLLDLLKQYGPTVVALILKLLA